MANQGLLKTVASFPYLLKIKIMFVKMKTVITMKSEDAIKKNSNDKTYSFLDDTFQIYKTNMDTFPYEEVLSYFTDYFSKFDYVLGDYAYHKLRLKGFYKSNSKKVTKINNISSADEYLKLYCAEGCDYFILKKCN